MSHFTCICIGKNPEKQLEKYDENLECPERIRGRVTKKEKEDFMDYYKEKDINCRDKSFEEIYELHGEDWNGNSWRKNAKGVWMEYTTYNKNSKWDWYQVGGRWRGFFKLKPEAKFKGIVGSAGAFDNEAEEGCVDVCLKGDIDIEGMQKEAYDKAMEHYNKIKEACGGVIPKLERTWEDIIDDDSIGNIEAKRYYYHNQEGVKRFNECLKGKDLIGWSDGLGNYQISAEDYALNHALSTIVPFAFVKNGKWYDKGKMGWWACVSDEKETKDWNKEFMDAFKALPDSTLITLYDCHI